MARPYSNDAVAGCGVGAGRAIVPGDGAAVRGQRGERGEVVAAAKAMGGYRRPVLLGERDWLLARLAEQPD